MPRDFFQACYKIAEAAQICNEPPEPLYLSIDEHIELLQDKRAIDWLSFTNPSSLRIFGVPVLRKPPNA